MHLRDIFFLLLVAVANAAEWYRVNNVLQRPPIVSTIPAHRNITVHTEEDQGCWSFILGQNDRGQRVWGPIYAFDNCTHLEMHLPEGAASSFVLVRGRDTVRFRRHHQHDDETAGFWLLAVVILYVGSVVVCIGLLDESRTRWA